MKRASPKEVWLHHNERTGWQFSFDPPTRRNRTRWYRMVSADVVQRQRAEIRRLHAENAASREVLKQCLEQACNILDLSPNPSARLVSMSLRGSIPREALAPKRKRESDAATPLVEVP